MWLGAQRALLLQLAHPGVGAAVDRFSTFRTSPHRRLWSTADTMLAMVWGRPAEALEGRALVMGIHDTIHGPLPEDAPPWHRGDRYDAHDPELVRWVWSTLVDTAEVVHERYVGPLSADRRAALFADWRAFGLFFGLPAAMLPATRTEFGRRYTADLEQLAVSDTARRVARAIVDPPLWWAPRRLSEFMGGVATSLLPEHLHAAYGLSWSAADERRARAREATSRRIHARLPAHRTLVPYAYLSVRRAARAVAGVTTSRPSRRLDQSRPMRVE